MKKTKTIAVFGGYRTAPGEPDYDLACELGRQIASQGWALLNGGYSGTMEASARGAKECGGHVVGVPVELFSKEVNAFTDEAHLTKDLWERIRYMLDRSDAFVILPGSTGTLAEIGMAWEFVCKKLMPPKPIIFLGEFWAPLYKVVVVTAGGRPSCGGLVRVEQTVAGAMDFLKGHWER